MGCHFSSYNIDTIQGKLEGFQYDTHETNIFVSNNEHKIVLHKLGPNYPILLEKVKKLNGKMVIITYEQENQKSYRCVLDIKEYTENIYTGVILHIVGLSIDTKNSEYYEIIFEKPKENHIFVIQNNLHKNILEVGNEYTINYEFLENNYYKITNVIENRKVDSDGYIVL